jgi:hypothetical protein
VRIAILGAFGDCKDGRPSAAAGVGLSSAKADVATVMSRATTALNKFGFMMRSLKYIKHAPFLPPSAAGELRQA